MTLGETQTTTDPSATVTPAAPQPPASPRPGLNSDTHDEDGKTWKDKFYGASGRLKQVEAASGQRAGELEQQIAGLRQTLSERDATIARLQGQVDNLTAQAQTIPQLQGERDALASKAKQADRLKVLMGYPQLLGMTVEETVVGTDGQPVTTKVNPFLNLIDATNLEGDALAQELQRLINALPVASVPVVPQAPVVPPTVPPQPVPSGTGDAASLQAEAMKWHNYRIYGAPEGAVPPGTNLEEEERKAWARYYEEQSKATAA